jgi:hypothetical protein
LIGIILVTLGTILLLYSGSFGVTCFADSDDSKYIEDAYSSELTYRDDFEAHEVPFWDKALPSFEGRWSYPSRGEDYRVSTYATLRTINTTCIGADSDYESNSDYGFPAYWFAFRPLALELDVLPSTFHDFYSIDVIYALLDFAGEWR